MRGLGVKSACMLAPSAFLALAAATLFSKKPSCQPQPPEPTTPQYPTATPRWAAWQTRPNPRTFPSPSNEHGTLQSQQPPVTIWCPRSITGRSSKAYSGGHSTRRRLATCSTADSRRSPAISRGNSNSHRLSTGNKHMSTPHMRIWRNGRRQRSAWIGLPHEFVTRSSMTWFGELSRRHRFRRARNPSDYRGLTVKDPTEWLWSRGLVANRLIWMWQSLIRTRRHTFNGLKRQPAQQPKRQPLTKQRSMSLWPPRIPSSRSPSKQAMPDAQSWRNWSKTLEDGSLRLLTSRSR